MMLMLSLTVLAIVAMFALNIFSTTTLLASTAHSEAGKRNLIVLVWVAPVFGTVLAMVLMNRDLKKAAEAMDKEVATKLRLFADKIKVIEQHILDKQQTRP